MTLLLFLLLLSHGYFQSRNSQRKHHREDAGAEPCRQCRGLEETRWAGHRAGGGLSRHKDAKQCSFSSKGQGIGEVCVG